MLYLSDALPALTAISVNDGLVDAAMLLNMGTGWPQLRYINLRNSALDATAVATIQEANWHRLGNVCLDFNLLGAAGMQHLASCSCPSLQT